MEWQGGYCPPCVLLSLLPALETSQQVQYVSQASTVNKDVIAATTASLLPVNANLGVFQL